MGVCNDLCSSSSTEIKLRRRSSSLVPSGRKEVAGQNKEEDQIEHLGYQSSIIDFLRLRLQKYLIWTKDSPDELAIPFCKKKQSYEEEEEEEEEEDRWWQGFEQTAYHHLPLLMLTNKLKKTLEFLSLSTGRVYRVKLPFKFSGGDCNGSSNGWLIMMEKIPIKNSYFICDAFREKERIGNFLFHPFLKETIQIPPQSTVPFIGSNHRSFIKRAILSCAPTRDNMEVGKCVVVAICNHENLIFCRPGDDSWAVLDTKREFGNYIADIIFYEERLYAINYSEDIGIFHVLEGGGGDVVFTKLNTIKPKNRDPGSTLFFVDGKDVWLGHDQRMYLVESDGNLLMVSRIFNYIEGNTSHIFTIQTVGFKVYKLDQNSPQWIEMESLGKHMLFLGINCSKSFTATDLSGFQENCIYFTDTNLDDCSYELSSPPYGDLGVFRMDNGSIESYFPSNFQSCLHRPVWVELPQYN